MYSSTMSMAGDDDVDFSSFLVDLDDDLTGSGTSSSREAAGVSTATGQQQGSESATSYTNPSNYAAASKTWSKALHGSALSNDVLANLLASTASVSPSPPDSTDDVSSKSSSASAKTTASMLTAGDSARQVSTAPSSIGTSGSGSSWSTVTATAGYPHASGSISMTIPVSAQDFQRSVPNSPLRVSAFPSSTHPLPQSESVASPLSTMFPLQPVTASGFSLVADHSPVNFPSGHALQGQPTFSASMPNSDYLGWASHPRHPLHAQQAPSSSMSSTNAIFANPSHSLDPSSGPTSAVRSHRSRQSSTHNAHSPGGTTQHQSSWLSLNLGRDGSTAVVSHPYARPEPQCAAQNSSSTSSGVATIKKATRRKRDVAPQTGTANNQTATHSISSMPTSSHAQNRPKPMPIATPSYSLSSTATSPTSPLLENYGFSQSYDGTAPSTAPQSSVASPSDHYQAVDGQAQADQQVKVGLQNDTLPYTPSTRDLTFTSSYPQRTDVRAVVADILAHTSDGQRPDDLNSAVALSGVGGKWYNWAAQDPQVSQTASSVMSNVFSNGELFPAPPTSGTVHSTGVQSALSPAVPIVPGPRSRETSLGLEDWPTIDGETPESMAAKDPLATQLWRLYAKAKAGLPGGARMENITWRLMSLKLNKQKAEAEAEAEKKRQEAEYASTSFAVPHPPSTVPVSAASSTSMSNSEKYAAKGTEVGLERGRRGRLDAASATQAQSPEDDDELNAMDWRNQSRSRTRVSHTPDGMDWRAQSRSRSRAPHVRFGVRSASPGFRLLSSPSDPAITQAFAAGMSADVPSYTANLELQTPNTTSLPSASSTSAAYKSVEETLRSLMSPKANKTEVATMHTQGHGRHRSSISTMASHINISPTQPAMSEFDASLPQAQDWFTNLAGNSPASELSKGAARADLPTLPSQFPSEASAPLTDLAQSKNSISASLEAYLSTLDYSTSVLDLPTHKNVGSIPGLFREQELKQNHHADFGFLPKLVRKTSFDESYPASIVQAQQKQSHKKHRQQGSTQAYSTANSPQDFGISSPQGARVAQSVPGTPVPPAAPNGFPQPNMQMFAVDPAMMSFGTQYASPAQLYMPAAQTAALEAINRLQAAQAMQSAAQAAAFMPPITHSMSMSHLPVYQTTMPTYDFMASPGNLHINPTQVLSANSASYLQQSALPNPPDYSDGTTHAGWSHAAGTATPNTGSAVNSPAESSGSEIRQPDLGHASAVGTHPAQLPASAGQSSLTSNLPVVQAVSQTEASATSGASTPHINPDRPPAVICINCKTTTTPLWRRDENGQPLCNACQLFRKLHGADRPVSLHNSVIKKRNRTRNKDAVPKKAGSRAHNRRDSITQDTSQAVQ